MKTRTGNFPLGFRRMRAAWQQDLGELITWTKAQDLEVIDLANDADQLLGQVIDAGLQVGSVDLVEGQGMISANKETRAKAIEMNAAYIRACATHGPCNHFVVMMPEDPQRARAENFDFMIESYAELVPVFEEHEARLVIEGYPGPGALCCTPETYGAFFEQLPSPAMGINYDPSHLVRMGIDPLRFLNEFVDRVYHVHGKDTELLSENLYLYGNEQPPTFGQKFVHGAMHWRYTIPGHGLTRWTKVMSILAANGYNGCVSIELEDANFHGAEADEQLGIVQGAQFLAGC